MPAAQKSWPGLLTVQVRANRLSSLAGATLKFNLSRETIPGMNTPDAWYVHAEAQAVICFCGRLRDRAMESMWLDVIP